jgi:glycosyltransferase involved in cell wall biosynthesis
VDEARTAGRVMRVLHVDTGREWRGGQQQLYYLAPRVGVGVVLPRGAPLKAPLEALGVPVFEVGFHGSLWGTGGLRRVIASCAPDLVAAHTSHAHAHALAATRGPVVVHRRVDFAPSPWSRRKYRRATGFIAVSDAVSRVLKSTGVPGDRVCVVPDAVAPSTEHEAASGTEEFLRAKGNRPVLLAVGALVDHKGHRYLVEAMGHLQDCELWVFGVGPNHRRLASLARRVGVSDRVRFWGYHPGARACMGVADMLVHPSTDEGRGQVVIEAMLAGLPVVATDVGGIPETLGEVGVCVPARDVEGLVNAIRTVLADLPKHRAQVRGAQERVKEWCEPGAVARATQEAYVSFSQMHVSARTGR